MKVRTSTLTLEVKGGVTASILEASSVLEDFTDAKASWDLAYQAKQSSSGSIRFAEPNLDNKYPFQNPAFPVPSGEGFESTEVDVCTVNNDYDLAWPFPKKDGIEIKEIWHLQENFSQLKKARDSVPPAAVKIRIAHFDTGYDPSLTTYPASLINHDLERNFVDEKTPLSAVDHFSTGLMNQPGHGSGTLSILAGAHVKIPDYDNFDDSIGLASGIEIVPIRVSKSVILFENQAFTNALEYVIGLYDNPATRCHIVTMSMGGLASKDWADVVNRAYDKGIFIVTAAGNNFGRGTPTTVVYPARFRRVVTACGVTYDYSPYYKPFDILHPFKEMQGNFGPRAAMGHAIAAFTPNLPWAKIGCRDVVSLGGAGTSSATPQIASAAALYYMKYFTDLDGFAEGWKKVEAIRHALFESAAKRITGQPASDLDLYFGSGVLQAEAMLAIAPDPSKLAPQEPDTVRWPLFKLLTGSKLEAFEVATEDPDLEQMMELEVLQLIQQSSELQELLDKEETPVDQLSPEKKAAFIRTLRELPETSDFLKQKLQVF